MLSVDRIFIIQTPETLVSKESLELAAAALPWKATVEFMELEDQESYGARRPDEAKSNRTLETSLLSEMALDLAMAHWKIWTKAYQEDLSTIIVLENLVSVTGHHFHVLDTHEPWDIIYLGRESFAGDVPVGSGLVIPGYSDGSYAYLLSRGGIAKLLASGFQDRMTSICDFLTAMQGVNPDGMMNASFKANLNVLAPMKNFVDRVRDTSEPRVAEGYIPKNATLFSTYESNHASWVKCYLNPQLRDREFDLICDEPIANVYTFPLFTPRFCKEIIEEAEHYGQWTNYRYKDHASIDIMLSSIGFEAIYVDLLKRYVHPLFQHKYQLHQQLCDNLQSQHFVVRYLAEEQQHLGLHNDACDISMIVTLNTQYEGGGTFFPKFGKLIKHDYPGYASIHPGFIGYIHGARPITQGRRYILTSFFFRA